jgi:5-methylcytosine-specific restriction endonuclease McrA
MPGCPEVVTHGRCSKHGYKDNSGPTNPKYLRKPWRELRAEKLRREPLCRECFAQGIVTPALCVDHIDGDDANDVDANLQSLCIPCHSRKTAVQDGGFGNKPKALRSAIGVDGWPLK